ncbi:MAG: hypothetical protein AB7J35_20615 [Dehalococcoidia bacterium]
MAEFRNLTPDQQKAFLQHIPELVESFRSGRWQRGLRLKRMSGHRGIFELTWANDGRATFEYGQELTEGEPHIIWRRIGTHDILRDP